LECKFTDLISLRWPDVLKSGGKFPSLQESSPPPNPLSPRKETEKNKKRTTSSEIEINKPSSSHLSSQH
jgi:hypothetical protein